MYYHVEMISFFTRKTTLREILRVSWDTALAYDGPDVVMSVDDDDECFEIKRWNFHTVMLI